MFRAVAYLFVTYVETRLTHYNLRQISEAQELIPSEAHEDWDNISHTTCSAVHRKLHFAT
jgi:hypothetical protein